MRFFLVPFCTILFLKTTTAFTASSQFQPSHFSGGRSNNIAPCAATATATDTDTAQQVLDNLLETKDIDGAISFLQRSESIAAPMAAKLLTAVADESSAPVDEDSGSSSTSQVMVAPLQEQRLLECYRQIKNKVKLDQSTETQKNGLFGSVDMNILKLPYTQGCSIEQLETLTQLPLSAFRPNPKFNQLFYLGGAAAVILEVLISKIAGINPQPLFAATFASVLADQLLGGAASEKVMWTINPDMSDRVLKHEAGHLLVAHLLGCPVQSVALGNYDALTKEKSGLVSAGTSFFDPQLNAASQKGEITRSVLDRFSIIVMAGIAAEALCFGEAEGGSDDEKALTVFLSQTVQSNVNIPEQARWAATNALLLLKEHQDAYERLVTVLKTDGSSDIGKIILSLEGCNI